MIYTSEVTVEQRDMTTDGPCVSHQTGVQVWMSLFFQIEDGSRALFKNISKFKFEKFYTFQCAAHDAGIRFRKPAV